MAQKDYEVSRLAENNSKNADLINQLKEDVWNKQL